MRQRRDLVAAVCAALVTVSGACVREVHLGDREAGGPPIDGSPAGDVGDARARDGSLHDDAPLAPDGGAADQTRSDSAIPDRGGDASGFTCGELVECVAGSEYCEMTVGMACGGTPMPDSGTCPVNCKEVTCGAGPPECQCTGYRCVPLPAGCAGCICIPLAAGCTCIDGTRGDVRVKCAQ